MGQFSEIPEIRKSRKCRDTGNPEMSQENPKSRKCPGNSEIQIREQFSGFPAAAVCTRGIHAILGCFQDKFPDFRKFRKCRTVSLRRKFSRNSQNPGGFRVLVFTAVATYKMCKISRFWVFSGTDFPDFRNSNSNQGHICAFQNFRDFGNPDLKPCFHRNRSAAGILRDFGNSGDFRRFREISGLLHNWQNFRKISEKPEIQIWHFALFFSGARVSVYSVAKSEKPKPKMTLWNLCHFSEIFPGCFQGFSGLST
jgi:hypothetical protein